MAASEKFAVYSKTSWADEAKDGTFASYLAPLCRRRLQMLFAVLYTARDATEEKDKRSLNLFTNWKPPAGYEFKAHYALADGAGGMAIVEANSPAALLEAHAPWRPFFEFRTVPVVEIDKAVPIFQRVNAWRDSVK